MKRLVRMSLLLVSGLSLAPDALACASCGCTLNTDLGSQGMVSGSGWHVDLRYDLVDQTQSRSSDQAVGLAVPNSEEVEQRTRNGYYTLGIDYGFNRRWSVGLQLPWLDRYHTTYAEADTALSSSDSNSLSDARVLARYTGLSPDMSTGLLFGLKLPTGTQDVDFSAGPATGEALDRSLQPGSGTTDLMLGAYHFDNFNARFGWFAQVMYQHALAAHDGYRPGDSFNVNAGLQYYLNDSLTPQLQVNAQLRGHDTDDDLVGQDNSGGRLLYISPGVTFNLGEGWHGHAFVQFPLYQYVYGVQLTPTRIFSIGASYNF
ncbi:MAG TPA: transporter [Gammaproteobacteria bacterium]|nr:transporter [Gammaproteobacteria bacterium]